MTACSSGTFESYRSKSVLRVNREWSLHGARYNSSVFPRRNGLRSHSDGKTVLQTRHRPTNF